MLRKTNIALCLSAVLSPVFVYAESPTQLEEISIVEKKGVGSESSDLYVTAESDMATGLPLSVKDTPQSVSIVTQQQIKDRQLDSISKVLQATPGVAVREVDRGRFSFSSRGFAISKYQLDGMTSKWNAQYTAGDTMGNMILYDRVEVIRGATGLTVGSGDPSAAVNFVRKHADSTKPQTLLSATIGTYGNWKTSIDHSQALNASGTVRGRVIAQYEDLHSFVDREKGHATTLYATIDADLTPNTLLRLGVSNEKSNRDAVLWGGLPYFDSNDNAIEYARSRNLSPDWAYWNSNVYNYFGTIQHQFTPDWGLSLKANQRRGEGNSFLFYPWGKPNASTGTGWNYGIGKYDTELTQTDVQLDLTGKFSAWGLVHELSLGLSYNYEDRFSYGGYQGISDTNLNIFTFNGNIAQPTIAQSKSYAVKTIEKAIYGATRLNLTENLHLILGSRLSNWQRSALNAENMKISSQWTPYAGLMYDISPNHTLYVSYTDVFNPQTYYDINNKLLDPVVGSNYELGWKGSFMNDLLQTQFSIFHIRQDNLAESTGQMIPGTTITAYRAVDGAKVNGFDIELIGLLTDNWQVTASYTQWRGKDADSNPINTLSPRKQFKLFSTYKMDHVIPGLTIGGGVNWQSKIYTGTGAAEKRQSAYALVDLMARYQISERLSAQVNINNLFDKKYKAGLNQLSYGSPAYASLTLNYQF